MKRCITVLLLCLLAVPLFAAPWAREYHKEMKTFVSILKEDMENVDYDNRPNTIWVEITVESMTNTYDRNEAYVLMQKTLQELMDEEEFKFANETVKPYQRLQQHKEYRFTQLIAEYELNR